MAGRWHNLGRYLLVYFVCVAGMALLPRATLGAEPAKWEASFADGKIACVVMPQPGGAIPEILSPALTIAMKTALEHLEPPPEQTTLTIYLEPPPPFYKRMRALFRVEAYARQSGDNIHVQPGQDPLKLTFRLGHELSHWLTLKTLGQRPPLWLDEGLANWLGAEAAATRARTLRQELKRPIPAGMEKHLFTLDELTSLKGYPRKPLALGAFYWQAEALARAIHRRLGDKEFQTYLRLLSQPQAPDWREPLRERWYFSDGDFAWLAGQIQPSSLPQ